MGSNQDKRIPLVTCRATGHSQGPGGFPCSRSKICEEPLRCSLGKGLPEAGYRLGQHSLVHRLESYRCILDLPCQRRLAFSLCAAHPPLDSVLFTTGICCECTLVLARLIQRILVIIFNPVFTRLLGTFKLFSLSKNNMLGNYSI